MRFAEEVAARIERGRTGNEYWRFVLVAAPRFLGLRREKLPHAVSALIEAEFAKNISQMTPDEIRAHLPERLDSTL